MAKRPRQGRSRSRQHAVSTGTCTCTCTDSPASKPSFALSVFQGPSGAESSPDRCKVFHKQRSRLGKNEDSKEPSSTRGPLRPPPPPQFPPSKVGPSFPTVLSLSGLNPTHSCRFLTPFLPSWDEVLTDGCCQDAPPCRMRPMGPAMNVRRGGESPRGDVIRGRRCQVRDVARFSSRWNGLLRGVVGVTCKAYLEARGRTRAG